MPYATAPISARTGACNAMIASVPAQRLPTDPWYTVLYRDSYRYWWAPSAWSVGLAFLFIWLVLGEPLGQSLIVPTLMGAASLAGSLWRRRRGSQ